MMTIKKRCCGIAGLMVLCTLGIYGETWKFTASQVTSVQSENETLTILEGNARVESESMVIQADQLELGGPDYTQITGFGRVTLIDKDEDIIVTAHRFEYDQDTDIIRFRDMVSLVDNEEDIVIRCESLDLYEEDDLIIMQVAVRLIKDDTVCRGEFATFRRDENLLDLSGRPVVWQKDDEYRADRIQVNLDTEEIVMEGKVTGALTTEDTDEDEEEP